MRKRSSKSVVILTPEDPGSPNGGLGVHDLAVSRILEGRGWDTKRLTLPQETSSESFVETRWNANAEVARVLSNLSASLVLVHGHWLGLAVKHMSEKISAPKIVVVIHSLEADRPRRQEYLAEGYRLSLELEEATVRGASLICCPSQYMIRRVGHYYGRDVAPIVAIGNGVDFELFQKGTFKNYKNFVLSFVGRIEPEKGLDTLLNELIEIRDSLPTMVIRIYGCARPAFSEYYQEVLRLSESLGCGFDVQWMGFVRDRSSLSAIYRESSAVIVPSLYEPFGLVALEAMASSAFVIARSVGGLTEFIEDGVSGMTYSSTAELLGAIETALEHDRSLVIRSNATRAAKHFSWDRVTDKILAGLKRID